MKTKQELYNEYRHNSDGLEKYLEEQGFKSLGWQVHTGNCEELKKCFEAGHMSHQGEEKRKVRDIQHNPRGTDVTYWCEECKIYWKIDMGD